MDTRKKQGFFVPQKPKVLEEIKKSDKKDKQIEELTTLLKKVQADFENYKKRIEKEQKDFIECASKELVKQLLPVLDSFELALNNKDDKEFYKGVELIYAQLISTLENQGLTPIKALDKEFDPYLHEALMQETSDKKENTVIEELQRGYLFKEKVIRSTKVKVAKK
jgi:molecular chaperone GrpE